MVYKLSRNLLISKQMITFKYIKLVPNKPKKFGLTLGVLTGYCITYEVYTNNSDTAPEHGPTHKVVFNLLENCLNKNHPV